MIFFMEVKMFNLFKSKIDKNVYAPVNGKCIDITEVNDIGFASQLMGDGIAIIPDSSVVVAPCDGTLQMIFRTGHAFGMKADNGFEILIHIGIDTVNLEGKGFTVLKKVNQTVKKGEPIIEFDLNTMKEEYDTTIILVVTNRKLFHKITLHDIVGVGDIVLEGIDEYEADKKD